MEKTLGKLQSVKVVTNLEISNSPSLNGKGGRLGMAQMINAISGWGGKDGYEITTDKHSWLVLIDNGQSCCESWGYISSEDDFDQFLGKELLKVRLTDKGLNELMIKATESLYEGGIQFVTFLFTDNSALQFAVYNSHEGYYGHDILFVKDEEVLLSEVL